mgnify:FL=1
MEIIVFLSIVIAVVAVLTSIVLVRRVKKTNRRNDRCTG